MAGASIVLLPHPAEFLATFKTLTDELITDILPKYELSEEALAYIKRVRSLRLCGGGEGCTCFNARDTPALAQMIEYTVPGGKLNRGLTVVHALQSIKGSTPLTATELQQSALLGWCVEWVSCCPAAAQGTAGVHARPPCPAAASILPGG